MTTAARNVTKVQVLATLHPADLFRDRSMLLPSHRDWAKIPLILKGEWPLPVPERLVIGPENITDFHSEQFDDLLTKAHQAEWIAIDTEYDRETRFLTLIGVGFKHQGKVVGFQVSCSRLPRWAQGFLQGTIKTLVSDISVVYQNSIGAELPVLKQNMGIEYKDHKHIDDTMLAHAVLWSDWEHSLEFLASLYSPYNKLKQYKGSDFLLYNWGDVIDTIAVWEGLLGEFKKDTLSESIYREQSLKLIPLIVEAHERGIRVAKDKVKPLALELTMRKVKSQLLAQAACGYPINLGSVKQLAFYCYDLKKYKVPKERGKEKRTVSGDTIADLRKAVGPEPDLEGEEKDGLQFEAVSRRCEENADMVLEARVIYANALQEFSHYISPCFGDDSSVVARIFPEFKIHTQATGRWSTTTVPMAQLPKHLRGIICADEGWRQVEYDWDSIELRLIAALSQDRPLLEAFEKSWDIHTLTACELFNLLYPPNRVNPHENGESTEWRASTKWNGKGDTRRTFAKQFVYRLNYGGSAKEAITIPGARMLGLNAVKLALASNRYLMAHPGLSKWRASMAMKVQSRFPEVRTFMGRKRILLTDGPKKLREAYDTPMQAGVSDIANITAIRIYNELPWLQFLFQLHDGWRWQCPAHLLEESIPKMREIVEREWEINGELVKFPASFTVYD